MEKYVKEQSAVICPYDKSHIIHKSRIQRHLLKCARNFPSNYLETCPFNATHLMFQSQLDSHIEQCPDRKYIDSEQFEIKNHGSLKSCPPSESELSIDVYGDIWEDNDECNHDVESNISLVNNFLISTMHSRKKKNYREPHGYSETMMLDVNEESNVEDVESITSSMGRGKILSKQLGKNQGLRKIGKSRGYLPTELMKVGSSANTDVADLESVASHSITHNSMI